MNDSQMMQIDNFRDMIVVITLFHHTVTFNNWIDITPPKPIFESEQISFSL